MKDHAIYNFPSSIEWHILFPSFSLLVFHILCRTVQVKLTLEERTIQTKQSPYKKVGLKTIPTTVGFDAFTEVSRDW